MYIYTTPTTQFITLSHKTQLLCSRAEPHHTTLEVWSKRREFCKQSPSSSCAMARRWSFLPLPWLLLLGVLGDAVAALAVPRPLLGIAEPPAASPGAAAAGPVGASRPGGEGGRPDRSVAGADVILVGFAAAVVVVIFLYIRVTRKNSSGVGVGEKQEGGVEDSELKI